MQETNNELQKLQGEHSRLEQARGRLQETLGKAPAKLAEMKKQLPVLMVSTTLGEAPEDELSRFKAEMRKLELEAGEKEPTQEAVAIIDARIKSVFARMDAIQKAQRNAEATASYVDMRTAIAGRGYMTVQEHASLEHLAINAGEGIDFTRFNQALESYRSDKAISGKPSDFPPFVYVAEGIAA